MKMAAGLLLCCSAGMKDGGAFIRQNTGEFQFFKRRRRHGRNLRPLFDDLWRQAASGANFLIRWIVFELEAKKFQGERLKASIWETCGNCTAQARGEAG